MTYENLLREAYHDSIEVYEQNMKPTVKGLYCDRIIWINKNIATKIERTCILAEELGHYHTSSGDITDQKKVTNRKQEKRARNWAYEKLVPLTGIVQAYKVGVRSRYELAEHLDVIEEFLEQAIKHYQEKYGMYAVLNKYTIYFDPLGIIEMFE